MDSNGRIKIRMTRVVVSYDDVCEQPSLKRPYNQVVADVFTEAPDLNLVSEEELEEEEECVFQRAALPVASTFSNDFERGLPITGEEYLLYVRNEVESLPFLLSRTSASENAFVINERDLIQLPPMQGQLGLEELSLIWDQSFMDKFIELKNAFNSYEESDSEEDAFVDEEATESDLEETVDNKEQEESENNSTDESLETDKLHELEMPQNLDEKAWFSFCYQNKHEIVADDCFPFAQYFYELDQKTILRLIKLHAKWLKLTTITEDQYHWMFGCLVALDDCLEASEMSSVRELGKRCKSILDKQKSLEVPDSQVVLYATNILMIIAGHLGQTDLLSSK